MKSAGRLPREGIRGESADGTFVRDLKQQLAIAKRKERITREGSNAQIRALKRFVAKQFDCQAELIRLREQDAQRLKETSARLDAALAELQKSAEPAGRMSKGDT